MLETFSESWKQPNCEFLSNCSSLYSQFIDTAQIIPIVASTAHGY
jgi:hypothetical protein